MKSVLVLFFIAESKPKGKAIKIDNKIEMVTSSNVAGKRVASSVTTGCLVLNDIPKSP